MLLLYRNAGISMCRNRKWSFTFPFILRGYNGEVIVQIDDDGRSPSARNGPTRRRRAAWINSACKTQLNLTHAIVKQNRHRATFSDRKSSEKYLGVCSTILLLHIEKPIGGIRAIAQSRGITRRAGSRSVAFTLLWVRVIFWNHRYLRSGGQEVVPLRCAQDNERVKPVPRNPSGSCPRNPVSRPLVETDSTYN